MRHSAAMPKPLPCIPALAPPPASIPAPLSELPRSLEPLSELFDRHHGAIQTHQLTEAGYTKRHIAAAVRSGALRRFRRGYYLAPGRRPADAGVAALAGGALSCISALESHGLWVPHGRRGERHFRLTKTQARLWPHSLAMARYGSEDDVVHVLPTEWRDSIWDAVDPPECALVTAAGCVALEDLVAGLESALRIGTALATLEAVAADAPEAYREALALVDPAADSGLETLVRLRLHFEGIEARSQVECVNWPCDLVIGEWLVIELDGFAFHSDEKSLSRDHRKDRDLLIAGYTKLRFTYADVIHNWPQCLAQIRAAMAAGWHAARRPAA